MTNISLLLFLDVAELFGIENTHYTIWTFKSVYMMWSQGFGTKEEEEEDIALRIEKVIQKSPYLS